MYTGKGGRPRAGRAGGAGWSSQAGAAAAAITFSAKQRSWPATSQSYTTVLKLYYILHKDFKNVRFYASVRFSLETKVLKFTAIFYSPLLAFPDEWPGTKVAA